MSGSPRGARLRSASPPPKRGKAAAAAAKPAVAASPAAAKASKAGPGFLGRHGNVYLYVPNLIGAPPASRGPFLQANHRPRHPLTVRPSRARAGYARVLLTGAAIVYAQEPPSLSLILYLLAFICDELVRARNTLGTAPPSPARAPARRHWLSRNPRCGGSRQLCLLPLVPRAPRLPTLRTRRSAPTTDPTSSPAPAAPLRRSQDGRFARKFNQTSTFGAVLDMVTDRRAHTHTHGCHADAGSATGRRPAAAAAAAAAGWPPRACAWCSLSATRCVPPPRLPAQPPPAHHCSRSR